MDTNGRLAKKQVFYFGSNMGFSHVDNAMGDRYNVNPINHLMKKEGGIEGLVKDIGSDYHIFVVDFFGKEAIPLLEKAGYEGNIIGVHHSEMAGVTTTFPVNDFKNKEYFERLIDLYYGKKRE